MLLEIDNITLSIQKRVVLDGISLTVGDNEIVSLLGSNASGKTTTIRTILGLIKPDSGKIFFRNQDITGLSPTFVTKFGMAIVPENRRLFSDLTLKENLFIALPKLSNSGRMREIERIREYFPILHQKERLTSYAGTLSGGEQQQVALARALLLKPKLLLLDEPSMGLSIKLVKENFELFTRLRQTGISMLIVEQNVKSALQISDRCYVLQEGKIVLTDKSKNLIESEFIKNAYLREFI